MARREGSITQRSKGSWQIRYYGPPDANGKQKRMTETIGGTKAAAEKVLRDRLTALENGTFVPRQKETLRQFLESWLERYAASHVSPRTLQGYRQKVNAYVIPHLGGVRVQSLTPRHI